MGTIFGVPRTREPTGIPAASGAVCRDSLHLEEPGRKFAEKFAEVRGSSEEVRGSSRRSSRQFFGSSIRTSEELPEVRGSSSEVLLELPKNWRQFFGSSNRRATEGAHGTFRAQGNIHGHCLCGVPRWEAHAIGRAPGVELPTVTHRTTDGACGVPLADSRVEGRHLHLP